jgi:hypothetical protein
MLDVSNCIQKACFTQTEKLLLKSIEEIENVAPRFIESKKLDEQKARYFFYILDMHGYQTVL